MAGDGEEEKEYESDPEEAKMSLKMRRREASDDEEEGADDLRGADGEVEGRSEKTIQPVARAVLDSEGESDGQGAAGEYDDESDFEGEEEYYDDEEAEGEVEVEYVQDRVGDGLKPAEGEVLPEGEGDLSRSRETGESSEPHGEEGDAAGQTKEENKENEPFAVPKAGAFYMHDDRFGDNVGGRNSRRTFAGRRLWESKDDKKWRHDKFEELNPHGRQQQWRKSSRGRGRGRGRGMGRVNTEGNNWPQTYNYDNQGVAPKRVRGGRGPNRYQPLTKHRNDAHPQDTQPRTVKPVNRTSRASSARANMSSSSEEPQTFPSIRVASNLSSASPPFYPSVSSEEFGVNRKGVQTGSQNRSARPSVVGDKPFMQPPNSSTRGKNVVDSMGMEKLSVNEASSRPMDNLHTPHSFSTNASQASHPRDQSRGLSFSGSNSFTSSQSQFSKGRSSAQVHSANRYSVQGQGELSSPALAHDLGRRPGNVSQPPSHAMTGLSKSPLDSKDNDRPPESSKSSPASVGKGKGNIQEGGRGSFMYNGSQGMGATGAMGSGHVDPNYSRTPTFLPVMQFGAQHPGGIGVPAMGMAFPGYVANPQLGLRNSEMTWLPVLAGAAGALGASYCPPYMAVDGGRHVRPGGPVPPALASSSNDSNVDRPNNDWKPRQKSEIVTNELNHRQSKPRRYSEMSFGQ